MSDVDPGSELINLLAPMLGLPDDTYGFSLSVRVGDVPQLMVHRKPSPLGLQSSFGKITEIYDLKKVVPR